MDGLALLALACQQEIQEEDTFIDVKRLEQGVNKLVDNVRVIEEDPQTTTTATSDETLQTVGGEASTNNDDVTNIGEQEDGQSVVPQQQQQQQQQQPPPPPIITSPPSEIRTIGSMEETEHCERMSETKSTIEAEELEVDPPSIKNEVCEDDVIYIGEIKEDEEKFFERSIRTLEKSSRAISRHLSVENRGHFPFKIFANQFCKYSTFTGWHLTRSRGMMKINVKFQNLNTLFGPLIVRALLVRKDSSYRHFGVDIICEKHKRDVGVMSINHVLHPAPGMEFAIYFDSNGERNSLCFDIGKPKPDGSLEATIALKSMCNDTCFTCADPSFKQTENSRDLLLVLTLESPDRWGGAIFFPKG